MNLDAKLSQREEEIAEWIASGKRSKEIADALFRSPRTIENTAANIRKKIGISNSVEVCIHWFVKKHKIPISQCPLGGDFIQRTKYLINA